MQTFDTIVLGAGAAGMMAAAEAGKRGKRVLVVDHASAPGEKIRISGGGRCNFTNTGASPKQFLSQNPAFCISALKRYTAEDFIALVARHGIAYHEKTLGQLFCDGSSRQIVDMLLAEMRQAGAELVLRTKIEGVERMAEGFVVALSGLREGRVAARSLIGRHRRQVDPEDGATGIGYEIARQFGLRLIETRPALVPLTLDPASLEALTPLSGVAVDAEVVHGRTRFPEALLFTHRGLSGPAMLQISSYWREGDEIAVRLRPDVDALAVLKSARAANGKQAVQTALSTILPKRLAQTVAERAAGTAPARTLAEHSDKQLAAVVAAVSDWRFRPAGSEGYRTAEVTLGGVDTRDLDGRTMQAKAVPGLFFVGEVVDVTGWLGGYNFQWAWSSGWCAGQAA